MSRPVLSIRNLSISLHAGSEVTTVVDRIGFDLDAGEVLALVGESGCGKTKTAEAIMGLLPRTGFRARADSICLGELDLSRLTERDMSKVRGREISMIFQEPMTALDPVFTAGNQLLSVFRRHREQTKAEARHSALAMLQSVEFADAERIMQNYPYQLSGGMRQRVMIAMAMACRPRVLIADEPTSALDVTTQAQVLSQLTRLGREAGTSILLITHDLGVVAQYCDRAIVMLDGKIIEESSVEALFAGPEHPYTQSLLATIPGMVG